MTLMLKSETELRKTLEHGLLHGYWSIADYNRTARKPIYPSIEFLHEHEQFSEYTFRDMVAFRSVFQPGPTPWLSSST